MTLTSTPPPTERSSVFNAPREPERLRARLEQVERELRMHRTEVVSMRAPPPKSTLGRGAREQPWLAIATLLVTTLGGALTAYLARPVDPRIDQALRDAQTAREELREYQRQLGPWRDSVDAQRHQDVERDARRDSEACSLGAQLYWVAGCPVGRVDRERKRR